MPSVSEPRKDLYPYYTLGLSLVLVTVTTGLLVGEFPASLLIALSFVIPITEPSLRSKPHLIYTFWIIIAAHHATSLVNAFYTGLPGAVSDAITFHKCASAKNIIDMFPAIAHNLYCNFLTIPYDLFSNSLLFGQELSVFAFSLSLLLFYRIMELQNINRFVVGSLLLFGLMPHILVYTSVTLRESWQLLFFVSAVYYGLRFRLQSDGTAFTFFLFTAICLALLHAVLIGFALALIALLVLFPLRPIKIFAWLAAATLMVLLLGVMTVLTVKILSTQMVSGPERVIRTITGDVDNFPKAVGSYRRGVDAGKPRTKFSASLDTETFGKLIQTLPAVYIHYVFAPLLYKLEDTRDFILVANNLVRLALFLLALYGLVAYTNRRWLLFWFCLYLLMTCTWVLGTTNYGQASRHHVLSDWLLILMMQTVVTRIYRKRVT